MVVMPFLVMFFVVAVLFVAGFQLLSYAFVAQRFAFVLGRVSRVICIGLILLGGGVEIVGSGPLIKTKSKSLSGIRQCEIALRGPAGLLVLAVAGSVTFILLCVEGLGI